MCIPRVRYHISPYGHEITFSEEFQKDKNLGKYVKSKGSSKETKINKMQCYYTSIEAILVDVQAIFDNCILYNSPESEVVQAGLELIPALKRLISEVSTRHMREQNAIVKAEEDRKRLVMQACQSSALESSNTTQQPQSGKTPKRICWFARTASPEAPSSSASAPDRSTSHPE